MEAEQAAIHFLRIKHPVAQGRLAFAWLVEYQLPDY